MAPKVLQRDFQALAPNQKWLAGITCVATDEGWLQLALVLDLYARKWLGWAMSETMPLELTLQALAPKASGKFPVRVRCALGP